MALRIPRLSRHTRERLRHWRDKCIEVIVSPWNMIVGFFSWIGNSISSAWGSRHLRYMIQGLPALFATVGVIVIAAAVWGQDKPNLAAHYRVAFSEAFRAADYPLARTFAEKAIALDSPKDEYRFNLVAALEGEKKLSHAFAVARTLAPDESVGYPAAHVWLADIILKESKPTPQVLKMAENHYRRAFQGARDRDPKSADTKRAAQRLGFFLTNTGNTAEAEKFLLIIADDMPIFKIHLASLFKRNNRHDEAKRMFESAVETFKRKSEASIDDHNSRMAWVEALIGLDRLEEAIHVATQGMTASKDKTYPQKIASIYAVMESKPDNSMEKRLVLIQKGLQVLPSNPQLLERLIEFSKMTGPEGEQSKQLMEELLAKQVSAPILHFLLGNRAYAAGDYQAAKRHWEAAYKIDQNFLLVANNLAFLTAQNPKSTPEELDGALKMIDEVLLKAKDVAAFHGTRGEILYRVKRHKEAINELRWGLQMTPNSVSLHEALAECYAKTENPVEAENHRRLAEKLRQQNLKQAIPGLKLGESDQDVTVPSVPEPPASPSPTPASKDKPEPKSGG